MVATAASGKPNRRKLDDHSAAALWYRRWAGETDHTFFCLERNAIIMCVCMPTCIMCNGSKITFI